jgi:predicted nucleotidyltransferase
MNLQALAADIDLGDQIIADIAKLLELKRTARETGTGPRMTRIDDLIRSEFEAARKMQPIAKERTDLYGEAEALFRRIVKHQTGGGRAA